MCNSLLISSDYKSVYLIGKRDEDRLYINGNGLLLSMIGNSISGCEVAPSLRKHVGDLIRGDKPFFEIDITEAKNNHLTISFDEDNSTLYIIGITDIVGSFPVGDPDTINPKNLQTARVKLKASEETGITSTKVVYIKTDINVNTRPDSNSGESRSKAQKLLRFYLLDADSSPS